MKIQVVRVLYQLFCFILLMLVLHLRYIFAHDSHTHVEKRLRDHLFSALNYSSLIRPVRNAEEAIHVRFNMKLMQVLAVDERDQQVTTQSYYSMKWMNEFLTWDPNLWDGVKKLKVKRDMVWIPDIILKNNADNRKDPVQEYTDYVWISSDGINRWYPKVVVTSSFKANVRNFPFDKQKFIFHFGSWSLGADKLRIKKNDKKPMIDKYYVNSTEWRLYRMEKTVIETGYDSNSYSDIKFIYCFSRKPSYCVITAILPCVMIMIIVLSSYLLPPNCGERIGVLITAILAFTVFLQVVITSLPRNSDSIPILKIFYLVTMGECTICFLASCLAIRLLSMKVKEFPPLPSWATWIIYRTKCEEMIPILQKLRTPTMGNCCRCENGQRKSSENIALHETKEEDNVSTRTLVKRNSLNYDNSGCNEKDSSNDSINHPRENGLNSKASDGRAMSRRETEMAAWKFLVEYVDRLCPYVFFILFLMSSFAILLPAAYHGKDEDD